MRVSPFKVILNNRNQVFVLKCMYDYTLLLFTDN